jgi:hypothetical protein
MRSQFFSNLLILLVIVSSITFLASSFSTRTQKCAAREVSSPSVASLSPDPVAFRQLHQSWKDEIRRDKPVTQHHQGHWLYATRDCKIWVDDEPVALVNNRMRKAGSPQHR